MRHLLFCWAISIGFMTLQSHARPNQQVLKPANYTLHSRARLVSQPDYEAQDKTFYINVGDNTGIEYEVYIIDKDGNVICEAPLEPEGEPIVSQENQLFQSSLFTQNAGTITAYYGFPAENPFYFVPWYAGTVTVMMPGTGCGEEWEITSTLIISGSRVTPVQENFICPQQPVISRGNSDLLAWATEDGGRLTGCTFPFAISNGLDRQVNYGAVQLLASFSNYLVIGKQPVPIMAPLPPDSPLPWLDTPGDPGQNIITTQTVTIAPSNVGTIAFTDLVSMELGDGCAIYDNGTRVDFDAVGLQAVFNTFIMQDYDAAGSPDVSQTPLGGPASVVGWGVDARAKRIGKVWQVDSASALTGPQVLDLPPNYNPAWQGYPKQPGNVYAQFDDEVNCYRFYEEGKAAANLR